MKTHKSSSKIKLYQALPDKAKNTWNSKNSQFQNQQSHWRFSAEEKKKQTNNTKQ
jgi:hypothetical protein